MFPQGNMEDSTDWEFKRHLAFTPENKQEDAEYVMGMVADSHMTLGIELPEHLDTQTVWATQTSTDSNASLRISRWSIQLVYRTRHNCWWILHRINVTKYHRECRTCCTL